VFLAGVNAVKSKCKYPGLTVKKRMGSTRVRKVSMISGVANLTDLRVHNPTIVNLERGVLERVFFINKNGGFTRPPLPTSEIFNLRMSAVRSMIIRSLPSTLVVVG
jgi:hypothetical protein